MSDNPAGWQPDPTGKHDHRYWDGTQWTENVADAGVASTDPYEAAAGGEPVDPGAPPPFASPDEPTAVTAVPTDDTSSYPTAPPPYVPPSPVADPSGGGGSKRGLIVGGAILAAVAIAVTAFLALGGDDEDDVRSQLASTIAADSEMSDDQASCVADLVVDEAGEDAFDGADFDAEDPPPEFVAAVGSIGIDTLMEECDLDEQAFGDPGSTDEGTDEGTDESADGGLDPSTTGGFTDGGMEDILTDAYEEMGLSEEQASCLTDRIVEAMESGELNQEEAMSEVFSYLSDCDISMDDFDPNAN